MASTAIQNIKILHKRYSSEQWLNGIVVNGETIIPKLAQGELGLDTTTLEVRIGTNSSAEQRFADAKPVGTDLVVKVYSKDASGNWIETSTPPAGTVVVKVEEKENTSSHDSTHEIHVYYDKISVGAISDFPDFKVNSTTSDITADTGEIKVVTSAVENSSQEHQLDVTYGVAATKDYVDSRKLTVVDTGSGAFITDIEESNANGEHTITVTRADVEIDIPELVLVDNMSGDYISNVSVDDHTITVTRGTLPVGTGSKEAGDLEFISSVSLDGHTLTATSKGIKGDDKVISVIKDTDGKVKISADTYTKAEIDTMHEDLAKAMKFAGTLDVTGTNGIKALPANAKQGDVYKVVSAGVYQGTQVAKVGDLYIYDGSAWRYVPSGDESFTDTWRAISVNGEQKLDTSIGSGALDFVDGDATKVTWDATNKRIKVSHDDTSSVEDLTKVARQYIDSLTFDEYGHVTGYTVGEETDQPIPGVIGGVTSTDPYAFVYNIGVGTNLLSGDHQIYGALKSLEVDDTLIAREITSPQGNIKFSHKTVTTGASTATAQTITAGDTVNNKFTIVDSISNDGHGHITDVKTKEITVNIPEDQNTEYELDVRTDSTTAGETSAKVVLTDADTKQDVDSVGIKVDSKTTTPAEGLQVSVSGDTITLTGKATKDLLGLIRAAYNLNTDSSAIVSDSILHNYSGSHNDRLYGVNVKADGTAFVEVPWTNTTYTADEDKIHLNGTKFEHTTTGISTSAQNAPVDLYAIGTDATGHVSSAIAITTIDGNYA